MDKTFTSGFYNEKKYQKKSKIELTKPLPQLSQFESFDPVSSIKPSISASIPSNEPIMTKPANTYDESKKKKKKVQPLQLKFKDDDELETHPLLEAAIQSSN